jgi:hypothetical protein
MQLMAWGVASLAAALGLRHRPFPLVMSSLVLWCLLPGIAAHHVVGQPVSGMTVHPAAVAMLATFAVQVLSRPGKVGAVLAARFQMWVMLGTTCLVAVALGLMAHGLMSFGMALEQLCAPVAALLLIGICLQEEPRRAATVHRVLVSLAAMEATLALVQLAFQSPLVFAPDYASQPWFRYIAGRSMGTLDHPLVLGLLLALAIPLLTSVRRPWVLPPALVLLAAGLVTTQSRVGLILGGIGAAYVLATRRSRGAALSAAVLLLATGLYAQQAGYFYAVSDRIADDTGSAAARGFAWSYFLEHLADFSWLGAGMGASYNVADRAGLGTSFENSFVMYAIDLGLIPALMYFGAMVACLVTAVRNRVDGGLPVAAAAAFIAPLTFSALSSRAVASCLVWVVFAGAVYGPRGVGGQRRPHRLRGARKPSVPSSAARTSVRQMAGHGRP